MLMFQVRRRQGADTSTSFVRFVWLLVASGTSIFPTSLVLLQESFAQFEESTSTVYAQLIASGVYSLVCLIGKDCSLDSKEFLPTMISACTVLKSSCRQSSSFIGWQRNLSLLVADARFSLPLLKNDNRRGSNYSEHTTNLPPLMLHHARFHSTATVERQQERQKQKSQDEESSANEASTTRASNLLHRAQTMRHNARQRADDMSHQAQHHLQEFRDHPQAKTQQSAQTFGSMLKRYGPVFVGTYFTVYVSTLLTLFGGVESGVLDPVVLFQWLGQSGGGEAVSTVHLVVDWMEQHSWTAPYAPYVEKNPSMANLAVAWIAVKFTEPIRFGLTLGITPRVARYFGYAAAVEEEEKEEEETTATESSTSSDSKIQ